MPSVPVRATLTSATLFNTPAKAKGTVAQQQVFANTFVKALNATPAGETVTISTFALDQVSVADQLIAANRRGVNIRMNVWDQRAARPALQKVLKALGSNVAARSYVKVCTGSCRLAGALGVQHAKVITITRTIKPGGVWQPYIVFVGSANLTGGNSSGSWNDTQLIVGNRTLFTSATAYVAAMRFDKEGRNFPSVTSGAYQFYYFPRTTKTYDPVLSALKATTCTAPKGYGAGGHTVVRLVMYDWTTGRKAIADRLIALKKAGCDVKVNLTSLEAANSIMTALIKAKIPTYDGYVVNKAGGVDMFQHGKSLIIDGKVSGKSQHIVYAGSANLTINSITDNTEVIVKLTGATNTAQYLAWFNRMQPWAKLLKVAPVYPPKPAVKGLGTAKSVDPLADEE